MTQIVKIQQQAQPIQTKKVQYKGHSLERKKMSKSPSKKVGMTLPPINPPMESYASLVQVKRKDPQTTKSAVGMYSIKPKQKKVLSKIDTMELNRQSSAGSIKTPKVRKQKKIKNQSNSAMSKYPSPRKSNVSSMNSGDKEYESEASPRDSTPRSRILVQSMLSDYDFQSQKKSVMASR